jgi:hypothetical protein
VSYGSNLTQEHLRFLKSVLQRYTTKASLTAEKNQDNCSFENKKLKIFAR